MTDWKYHMNDGCPVALGDRVEIDTFDGTRIVDKAGNIDWRNLGDDGVYQYRVIEDASHDW